jgi:DNA-binding transcriptional regulator LsrR (DeoR family)
MGPDELVRIGYVAERHYRRGRSQVELAAELGVSRFKIARMLNKAVELGIVRIEITHPDSIDTELSAELKQAYGLTRAVAVITPNQQPQVVFDSLGRVAAELLGEVVGEGELIGIASGRTLQAATKYLGVLPKADVVSLNGISNPEADFSSQVILSLAGATGGSSWPIYAPFIVESPTTAAALRSDPRIKAAMALHDKVTLGVVVIGSWNPPDSQFYDLARIHGLADELVARGVVGEVCATLLDAEGNVVRGIEDYTLSISDAGLRRIPEVIAVAGGPKKTSAIRAALLSGLIDTIVTDAELARRLLS